MRDLFMRENFKKSHRFESQLSRLSLTVFCFFASRGPSRSEANVEAVLLHSGHATSVTHCEELIRGCISKMD